MPANDGTGPATGGQVKKSKWPLGGRGNGKQNAVEPVVPGNGFGSLRGAPLRSDSDVSADSGLGSEGKGSPPRGRPLDHRDVSVAGPGTLTFRDSNESSTDDDYLAVGADTDSSHGVRTPPPHVDPGPMFAASSPLARAAPTPPPRNSWVQQVKPLESYATFATQGVNSQGQATGRGDEYLAPVAMNPEGYSNAHILSRAKRGGPPSGKPPEVVAGDGDESWYLEPVSGDGRALAADAQPLYADADGDDGQGGGYLDMGAAEQPVYEVPAEQKTPLQIQFANKKDNKRAPEWVIWECWRKLNVAEQAQLPALLKKVESGKL